MEALKGECPEAEEIKDWEDMVEQLKEAYGQIAKKVVAGCWGSSL